MVNHEKNGAWICRIKGEIVEFYDGDKVFYYGIKCLVRSAPPEDVPNNFVAIEYAHEPGKLLRVCGKNLKRKLSEQV